MSTFFYRVGIAEHPTGIPDRGLGAAVAILMDGAGHLKIYSAIIQPMMRPALGSVTISFPLLY